MALRVPAIAGIAASILFVATQPGCAYRWQLSEPTEPTAAAQTDPADQDAELSALVGARRQLEQRLARVEQRLLSLSGADEGDDHRREELLTERLSITVALVELDRAIEARRADLADPGLSTPPHPPARAPDPAKLVSRAEERIAVERRSGRRHGATEVMSGKGLLRALTPIVGATGGDSTANLRGRGGALDDSSTLGVGGGKGRGDTDLDALIDLAAPRKRKQSASARAMIPGDQAEKEEERKARDERNRSGVKAAVVNAGGPPVDVMPAIRRHRAQLLACLPGELRDGGVRITVRARVAASGSFRTPQITGVPALSPGVAACVADVIQQIRLPPQDDSRSVQFSLRFQGS